MSENKPGDVLRVVGEQFDADGNKLSKVVAEWYGFDNTDANAKSMEIAKGITALADKWAAEKAGRGKGPTGR